MPEHTRLPWRFGTRNWKGLEDGYGNLYVTGDHQPGDDDDTGGSCVGVAIVSGNPTAGGIPTANAELICRAVNSHADLLAACKAILKANKEATSEERLGEAITEIVDSIYDAVAKAEGDR